MVSLKRQVKEMKKSIQEKDEQLLSLKRNLKVTKLQETEVKLKNLKQLSFFIQIFLQLNV